MMSDLDLRLAELLAARLCHELAGAITAVANGIDLLGDPAFEIDREALGLVGDSARRAAARLQFYRFAYGFAGSGGTAGPPPCDLAAAFCKTSRIVCDYGDNLTALAPIRQKLACNLLALGSEALLRGGRIAIDTAPCGFQLEASGQGVCLAPEQSAALALQMPAEDLTSRTVQAYFTGLLARAQGWRFVDAIASGCLYITSAPVMR